MYIISKKNIKKNRLLLKYLNKETNKYENAMVLRWLSESTENMQYFRKIKSLWENNPDKFLNDKYHTKNALQDVLNELKSTEHKNKRKIFPVMVRVAAILILILSIFIIYKSFSKKEIVFASTSTQKELVLPDGSKVWLNENSTLKYFKTYLKNRTMFFEGEGFFEIAKVQGKPFRLNLNKATILVLGTSFNVKTHENIEVVVKSGKVFLTNEGVKSDSKKILLKKGDKGIVNLKTLSVIKQKNKDVNYLSWKTKNLVFENTKLKDVVAKLNYIYNSQIIIGSPEIENCLLYATFDNQSLENILSIIQATFSIEYVKEKNKITLRGNGC